MYSVERLNAKRSGGANVTVTIQKLESFYWECREQFTQVILEPGGGYLLMTAPAFAAEAGAMNVRIARRELYSSPNGDRWYLARDTEAGRVFIMHEPNDASGGKNAEIELGSFFNRSGHGPEHQELVRLIASLIDDPRDTSSA